MHELPVVALLAGGLATRMLPATAGVAKSMLLVAGEPFLGHQLRMLVSQGVKKIVICSGHLEKELREYAGDGSRWGCSITYSADGSQPLGTGGAIRQALPLLGPAFMVMYGDSYLAAPLTEVWDGFLAAEKDGLMTVYRNADRWDKSNIVYSRGTIRVYDKETRTSAMEHIDYGLSCFRSKAFTPWPLRERFDLSTVASELLFRGQLAGFEVKDRFYEIGSPAGFAETDAMLRGQQIPMQP